jgi:hypothetical protein
MVPCRVIFFSEEKGADGQPKERYLYKIYGFDPANTGHDLASATIRPVDNAPIPSCLEFWAQTGGKVVAVHQARQALRELFKDRDLKEESNCL